MFTVNRHAGYLQAPRMMKENRRCAVARGRSFFGALTPNVNLTRAINSHPELLPLSTHSKKTSIPCWTKAFWSLSNKVAHRHCNCSCWTSYRLRKPTHGEGAFCPLIHFFHSNSSSPARGIAIAWPRQSFAACSARRRDLPGLQGGH